MTAPKLHLHNLDSFNAFWVKAHWHGSRYDTTPTLFALSHLEPPAACLICRQTAKEPAIAGWTNTTAFVVCRDCHSDCADEAELERKIADRVGPALTEPAARINPPPKGGDRAAKGRLQPPVA